MPTVFRIVLLSRVVNTSCSMHSNEPSPMFLFFGAWFQFFLVPPSVVPNNLKEMLPAEIFLVFR